MAEYLYGRVSTHLKVCGFAAVFLYKKQKNKIKNKNTNKKKTKKTNENEKENKFEKNKKESFLGFLFFIAEKRPGEECVVFSSTVGKMTVF